MTAIEYTYPDLRRLIRIAAWMSWVPILAALAITNWGGSDLQGLAVYVWSAGITVQLFVGLSLYWLRRAKSRDVPRDPVAEVHLDPKSLAQLEALEVRFSSEEFRAALRRTFAKGTDPHGLPVQACSSQEYLDERVLRMTIADLLLEDAPIELGEQDRKEVINVISNALQRGGTAS